MTARRVTAAVTVLAVGLAAALYLVSAAGQSEVDVFWLVDRAAGEVTLVLMTAAVVLGVVRAGRPALNPKLVEQLHVDVALLTVGFAAAHVVATVLGAHTALGPEDAVVPFIASYRGTWVGLGVLSGYLYLVATLTSWPLRRLPRAWWLWLHRGIYVAWPLAVVHALGAGSDARSAAYAGLDALAVIGVLAAVAAARVRRRREPPPQSSVS